MEFEAPPPAATPMDASPSETSPDSVAYTPSGPPPDGAAAAPPAAQPELRDSSFSEVGEAEPPPAPAAAVPLLPVERYFLSARLEGGTIGGKHHQGIVLHGPWRNQINVVGALARYNLDVTQNPIPPDITQLPPSGQWPGRMNFGGTAQTKRTQMVDRMALRFSKTGEGKCSFEGEGANRVGKYIVTGTGTFSNGGWDLECERVYTPNAPSLPPAPQANKKRPANPLAFGGAGPALSPRQPRASAPKKGTWGSSPTAVEESGARKKARKGGVSAAAQALDARPTLVVLYPQPGPGGNPLTAFKYPCLSAAKKRAKGLVENVQYTIRVPPEGGDGVLFPPEAEDALRYLAEAIGHKAIAPQPETAMPAHIITWDIDAPSAKRRPWAANVAAFSTEQRAAAYMRHLYATAGLRLKYAWWGRFDPGSGAQTASPQCRLTGQGSFEVTFPVQTLGALEVLAKGAAGGEMLEAPKLEAPDAVMDAPPADGGTVDLGLGLGALPL